MSSQPRLRMFAGPNGSGKSTLKTVLPFELLGVYINPDDMEREIRRTGILDFKTYNVRCDAGEVQQFFERSELLRRAGLKETISLLRFGPGQIVFEAVAINSYYASVAADFLRQKLLASRASFSFETVMSSADKIEVLRKAHLFGYRNYLYFIATEDPMININRVRLRVSQGGHDVPEEKIVGRYGRSLDLLVSAIRETDRAYVFDNSGENKERVWVAEITAGATLELKTDRVPAWFQRALLDKVS